jgi:hypothetical protein
MYSVYGLRLYPGVDLNQRIASHTCNYPDFYTYIYFRPSLTIFGLFHMRFCRLCVVGFISLYFSPVYSQSSTDSSFDESVSAFRNIYFEGIKGNAQLYEGSKYDIENRKADGFPFFQADIIRQGTISYGGTRYTSQKFYYDITRDAVVIFNYEHDAPMLPDQKKIDSFSIGRHLFVRLGKLQGLPLEGFYEQLYAGDPGLYARREKKFYYGTGNQESRYVEKNEYYIRTNHMFNKCDNKSGMLAIFSDQADAMKKYIRSNHINFKEDLESALLSCVIYYSGLKR